MHDEVFVGSSSAISNPIHSGLAVDFTFGCQITESGMFRAQKEIGIMGMANNATTLVPMLYAAGKASAQLAM